MTKCLVTALEAVERKEGLIWIFLYTSINGEHEEGGKKELIKSKSKIRKPLWPLNLEHFKKMS